MYYESSGILGIFFYLIQFVRNFSLVDYNVLIENSREFPDCESFVSLKFSPN